MISCIPNLRGAWVKTPGLPYIVRPVFWPVLAFSELPLMAYIPGSDRTQVSRPFQQNLPLTALRARSPFSCSEFSHGLMAC